MRITGMPQLGYAPMHVAQPLASVAPRSTLAATPAATPPLQPVGSPGRRWQELAAQRAGIDPSAWDTDRGFPHNKQFVWAGYEYYRQMQLAHPQLTWAGMAFGIGPTFAAGLQDIAVLNHRIAELERHSSLLPEPHQQAVEQALALAGDRSLSDVTQMLERKLLEMQQAIFLDQGMQHEAYLGGGIEAIRELGRAGAIDDRAVAAWQQVDLGYRTGDRAAIERGNLELLRREQMQTIVDDYDEIRRMSPLVTYLLTAVGRPAIPGSQTPGQVVPVRIGRVRLPIPAIDISRADDRWKVIERDTWPAFTRLVNDHPADYQRMLTRSLDQRIVDGRFRHLRDDASLLDIADFLLQSLRRVPVAAR